ncbi:FkbM family methyltransferase [Shimia isoporae]|uniref:FkbM family methyltransferase n=1 Tax=Shimia isoporae TaxID=647720 RepID=A0A4R1NS90_9RHOB|nr:FkbM family methyltransferase [Shimia isoporae]TCL08118.1 FkbM family methyltransferase [Shimia isoporae]
MPVTTKTKFAQWLYALQWRLAPHEIETRYLSRRLPAGALDTFVDVGANIGMYTHTLRPKARRIFSFEPNAGLFEHTRHFYASATCIVEPMGVDDTNGSATLRIPAKDGIESVDLGTIAQGNKFDTSEHDAIHSFDIRTVAIDSYFSDHDGRIDLIKVDVEGNEFNVVKGAHERIRQDRPVWLIETELRHSDKVNDLFDLLETEGYRACYVARDNRLKDVSPADLKTLQSPENLAIRSRNPLSRVYVNNFFFVHPDCRIAALLT